MFYLASSQKESDWQIASALTAIFTAAVAPGGTGKDQTLQMAQNMVRPGSAEAVSDKLGDDLLATAGVAS